MFRNFKVLPFTKWNVWYTQICLKFNIYIDIMNEKCNIVCKLSITYTEIIYEILPLLLLSSYIVGFFHSQGDNLLGCQPMCLHSSFFDLDKMYLFCSSVLYSLSLMYKKLLDYLVFQTWIKDKKKCCWTALHFTKKS